MSKELDVAKQLIEDQQSLINQLKEIINQPSKEVRTWLKLGTHAKPEHRGINGAYFLRYKDGKFDVVDLEGVPIPSQLGIEIEQNLDYWESGMTVCKVGMHLNAYEPKKGTKENPWTKQEIEDMKKDGHAIFKDSTQPFIEEPPLIDSNDLKMVRERVQTIGNTQGLKEPFKFKPKPTAWQRIKQYFKTL